MEASEFSLKGRFRRPHESALAKTLTLKKNISVWMDTKKCEEARNISKASMRFPRLRAIYILNVRVSVFQLSQDIICQNMFIKSRQKLSAHRRRCYVPVLTHRKIVNGGEEKGRTHDKEK